MQGEHKIQSRDGPLILQLQEVGDLAASHVQHRNPIAGLILLADAMAALDMERPTCVPECDASVCTAAVSPAPERL